MNQYLFRKLRTFSALTLIAAPVLGACSDTATRVDTDRLSISAKALTLSPLGGSSYGITVKNAEAAPNNIVWSKTGITADQYGDGAGAISYVGPCDATSNPHTVELVLESLAEANGSPITEFTNPAPADRPIVLSVDCAPNADTPVTFNLTVMRAAQQGFFDIAVNFEDIFCSAKVDCTKDLLHDGDERGPTAVVGFACTAGTTADGAQPTWLHMTDLTLECDGMPPLYLDPTGPDGNNGPLGPLRTAYQTGIYRGQEQLPGLDKCYWNSAFGISVGAAPSCHLRGQATASHASFGESGFSPANTVYPYVDFDVLISNPAGELICTNNGLNVTGSGVRTDYTAPTGAAFTHEWECDSGKNPVSQSLACEGSFANDSTVAVLPTPAGLSVSIGGVRSPTYVLPDDRFVGNDATCCVNPCCDASTP